MTAPKKKTGPKAPDTPEVAEKPRAPRQPMSRSGLLDYPAKEGYQRYWAIDKDGMLERMQGAYWEYVKENGEKVTRHAGGGAMHYLMQIENKYYQEDCTKTQQQIINTSEQETQNLKEHEYVPGGRQNVLEREEYL